VSPVDQAPAGPERRTPERLRAHYEIERELADRLRGASRVERATLYGLVYDELFRRVPDHPQHTRKADLAFQRRAVASRLRLLEPHVTRESVFMEIGPGDCSLALEIAGRARRVYAVDVSAEITKGLSIPANLDLVICSGAGFTIPPGTVDVAYSNQVLEHLHPDDAIDHIRSVRSALKPGGLYVCVTPNRLSGPHDISQYFDLVATGLHLKEYTARELIDIFTREGYRNVSVLTPVGGRRFSVNPGVVRMLEPCLAGIPRSIRRSGFFESLLGITILARR
jgi:SAM-dependent methyltransferase